jgi:phage terminase small subunit
MAGLSPKQQRFVEEYLIDLNATAAAGRAGYKDPNIGRQLITKNNVAAAIAAAQQARSERIQITADRVLQEIALIAFSDLGRVLDFAGDALKLRPPKDIPEAARRALSSIKVKRYFEGAGDDAVEVETTEFKLWSKDAALEKLLRHLGMLEPKKPLRVDVTSGGKPLEQRDTLTAADITAAAALVGLAGLGVPAESGPQPVDPARPAPQAAGVPPPG